jgi:hypothetical protein
MHLKRSRTVSTVLLLALVVGAAYPGTGYGAITTIGTPVFSTGILENDQFSGGTYLQYAGAGPAPEYVSPVEGTIIRCGGNEVRLRVLRPAGGGKFTGVGTSAAETTSGSRPDTFATSLPVKVGDVIGVDNSSEALIFATGVPGDYIGRFHPELIDGAPSATPEMPTVDNNFQLQVNADIQPTSVGASGGSGAGGSGANGGTSSGSGGAGAVITPIAPSNNGVATPPRLTSSMSWNFGWTRRYTVVESLAVHGVPSGGHVAVSCKGRGCAFTSRSSTTVGGRLPCRANKCPKHPAVQGPEVVLGGPFKGRHLSVGARISVSILKTGSIGKSFVFTVRADRTPSVSVACLAPGSSQPGQGC